MQERALYITFSSPAFTAEWRATRCFAKAINTPQLQGRKWTKGHQLRRQRNALTRAALRTVDCLADEAI